MNETSVAGQPDYLQAWSLRRHPFGEQIDPEFFYAGSTLSQRLDLLTHLVQFSESIVVVNGPPGSGKTTLLDQFLRHANPQWIICAIDAGQGDPLSESLAQTMGVSPGEDAQTLLARWAAQSEASQQLIIVIDNTEQLDEAACRRICELADLPDGDRLHIVLFGTAEATRNIRAMLEQLGSEHTCQVLDIPRLTEEETAAYLMYRMAVAGYSGESPFTPTEVRAICKSAGGRPGHINRLANESLVDHHMRARIKKRAPIQRGRKKNSAPVWVGASLAIALLAGYLGWQRLTPTEPPVRDSGTAEQELPLILPAETIDSGRLVQDLKPSAGEAPANTDKTTSSQPVTTVTTAEPVNTPSAIPSVTNTEANRPLPARDVGPEPAEPASANAASATAETGTTRPVSPGPPDTSQPTRPARPEIPPALQARAAKPETQQSAVKTAQPHRENWLLQQSPDAFTLQLLGSRDPSSILDYIKSNSLEPDTAAFYRGRYRNADWYVLLYGLYPDKAAALAARSALPDKVQNAKPWPRTLKSVQDSINAAQ
ncbi:type II secretion system protein A [Thiogranum longum]|uniref:Type II secretion system protein A n=1 Tax=Thiogranum longum TaxID=1537524 RepID=A0A4R1HCR1_9GAMM|nr:AAA family ATPase [Thiogranum longum]TCK17009.1 type II secretion system protein A [Thiogranum longum]